jgi:hypothetical protein
MKFFGLYLCFENESPGALPSSDFGESKKDKGPREVIARHRQRVLASRCFHYNLKRISLFACT